VEKAAVEEAAVEEAAVEEASVEEAAVEEAAVEEAAVEEATHEEPTHPAVVTEELNNDGIEIVTEIVTVNDEEPTENTTESITETTSSESLDTSAISDLMAKNAEGLMTQQDFFRVFLMSVQNGISTNQRLEQIEKRLTDAEEKIKSTEEVAAVPAVEAETPVSEVVEEPMEVEAASEEPAAETPVVTESEKTMDESMDISSMVELAEKTRPSRKRGKVSQAGRASQSPIPSRAKRTRAK